MSSSEMNFDATQVAPAQPFDVLPKGWYAMEITESENKDIAAGKRLSLELTVDAGKSKGRKVFDGINWMHSNSETQRIGQEQLSAICHATGVLALKKDSMLVGKKLAVKLGIEEARKDEATGKEYDARNTCKGFKPLSELKESEMATSAPATGGTPMGSAAPADAPDWMKNPDGTPGGAAEAAAPAIPTDAPPAAPVDNTPPPPVKTDDERLAEAGWVVHPNNPAYWYKGQEVITKADALAKLAPAAPAAPPAPAATPAPAPAPAAAAATDSAAAAGDTPPWLQG